MCNGLPGFYPSVEPRTSKGSKPAALGPDITPPTSWRDRNPSGLAQEAIAVIRPGQPLGALFQCNNDAKCNTCKLHVAWERNGESTHRHSAAATIRMSSRTNDVRNTGAIRHQRRTRPGSDRGPLLLELGRVSWRRRSRLSSVATTTASQTTDTSLKRSVNHARLQTETVSAAALAVVRLSPLNRNTEALRFDSLQHF